MATNQVSIQVTQGADVAVQIVWSDDNGNPIPCDTPARAEVKDASGVLLDAFDDGADPETAAVITPSPTAGIIQLTAPKSVTSSWSPGSYKIDVFATVTDAAFPFDTSGQYRPAFSGTFSVRKAITTSAP
jgi:hypothetical protein